MMNKFVLGFVVSLCGSNLFAQQIPSNTFMEKCKTATKNLEPNTAKTVLKDCMLNAKATQDQTLALCKANVGKLSGLDRKSYLSECMRVR